MKISEYTLVHLTKAVCGDTQYMPYLTGPAIVHFFNKYGYNEVYGAGFPSRWKYTEDKLRELNGTDSLRKIIEDVIDPRRFVNLNIKVEDAIEKINEILKFDKYELKKSGDFYKVTSTNGTIVQPETAKAIDHDFINEQIEKCSSKIQDGDFNGAITNARSLIEAIFIEIIERHENAEIKMTETLKISGKRLKK
jgi:hypothetical protein